MFYISGSSHNVFENITAFSNSDTGILLYYGYNNTLTDINSSNNAKDGIYMQLINNGTLNNIDTISNSRHGIMLYDSDSNELENITSKGHSSNNGIYLESNSDLNIIKNVTIVSNSMGFMIISSDNNTLIDINASSNTNHGIYLYFPSKYNNLTDITCNSNGNVGIALDAVSNNFISDATITNSDKGVWFDSQTRNNILNYINANNNRLGFYMIYSEGNIVNNSVFNNTQTDFFMEPVSDTGCKNILNNLTGANNKAIVYYNETVTIKNWNNNFSEIILCNADNSIIDNVIGSNDIENNGIFILRTDYSNISNIILDNFYYGLRIDSSQYNNFTNITASNGYCGFAIVGLSGTHTSYNNITRNNFYSNAYGLCLGSYVSNNRIYDNIFKQTNNFLGISSSYVNYYNRTLQSATNIVGGSYIGGNVWTNETGNGFSHTCIDGDSNGICDSTYTLGSNNYDYLPLKMLGYNTVPVFDTVSLNSTSGSLTGDLYCWANATDGEDDNITYNGFWIKDGVEYYLTWNQTEGREFHDYGYDVAIDSSNNIIVVGYVNYTGDYDVFAIKYYPNGTEIWNFTLVENRDNRARGVAVDSDDNIIIVGYTNLSANNRDLRLFKYYPNGTQIWNVTYGYAYDDYGADVAIDSNDNIFTTGARKDSGTRYYFRTIKFYPNGTEVWNRDEPGPDSYNKEGRSITIDNDDNIIAAGWYGRGPGNSDGWLIKYDQNSGKIWDRSYGGNYYDGYQGVAVDSNNSIIAVGYYQSSPGAQYQLWIVKYYSFGLQIYNKQYGGGLTEVAHDVTTNLDNTYIIAGYTQSYGAGSNDIYLLKLFENGTKIWDKTYGDTNSEIALGITSDQYENFVITGYSNSWSSNHNLHTLKHYGFHLDNQNQGELVKVGELDSDYTLADEIWKCKVNAFDGTNHSGYNLSNEVLINNNISTCMTIMESGSYELNTSISGSGDCIDIQANDVTLDCNGFSISGDTTGRGIYINGYNGSIIRNCDVSNFYDGILFYESSNNNITNLNSNNNDRNGIYLQSNSEDNTITNSTFNNNYQFGINIDSNDNTIINCSAKYNNHGINLDNQRNVITNSYFNNNTLYGIYINSLKNNVTNSYAENNSVGIYIYTSSSNIIQNCSVNNNHDKGIHISGTSSFKSSNNNIINNNIKNNGDGIYFGGYGQSNNFTNNIINGNNDNKYQIDLLVGTNYNNLFINTTVSGNKLIRTHNAGSNPNRFIDLILKYNMDQENGTIKLFSVNVSVYSEIDNNTFLLNQDFVSMNSALSKVASFNQSANISLYVSNCSDYKVYKKTGFPSTFADITQNGFEISPSPASCTNNIVTFNVDGFSGYAAQSGFANGISCSSDSECASLNCVKEINSSNYYCAAASKNCSILNGDGYDTGDTLGAWLCTAENASIECSISTQCDEYLGNYCDGVDTWTAGSSNGADANCAVCSTCGGTASNNEGDLNCNVNITSGNTDSGECIFSAGCESSQCVCDGLANCDIFTGYNCSTSDQCLTSNCRKDIDSSDYYCAGSGNNCSSSSGGNPGYSSGGAFGSWLCIGLDSSSECNAGTICDTYLGLYCNSTLWNSGSGTSFVCDETDHCSGEAWYDNYTCNGGVGTAGACSVNNGVQDKDTTQARCELSGNGCTARTWIGDLGTLIGSNYQCCGDDSTSDDWATHDGTLSSSTSLSCQQCLNGGDQGSSTLIGNGNLQGSGTTRTCFYGNIGCSGSSVTNGTDSLVYGWGYYIGTLSSSTSVDCKSGAATCSDGSFANDSSSTLIGNGNLQGSGTTRTCYYGDITCSDGSESDGADATVYGWGYYDGSVSSSTSIDCYSGTGSCSDGSFANGSMTTIYGNGYISGTTCYYNDMVCSSGSATNGATCVLGATDICGDNVACTDCSPYNRSSTTVCYSTCTSDDDLKCAPTFHCFSDSGTNETCQTNANGGGCDSDLECDSGQCYLNICINDTIAPTTTDNAPIGWQGADVPITLSPVDTGGSGVNKTFYCVDQVNTCNPTTIHVNPFYIVYEGISYVRYYSNDNVNNVETINNVTVRLDKSSPNNSTLSITDPSGAYSTNGNITLSWTSVTDLPGGDNSGFDHYEVWRNATAESGAGLTEGWTKQNGNFAGTDFVDTGLFNDTIYCYQIRAVDNVSHYSISDIECKRVDSEYPGVNIFNPTAAQLFKVQNIDVNATYGNTYEVNCEARNDTSAWQSMIGGGAVSGNASTTLIGLPEGQHNISVKCWDLANLIQIDEVQILIDLTDPVTTDNAPSGWQDANVDVTLSPTDSGGSGLDDTYYCVDTANSCNPTTLYSSAVTISNEATNYIRYYSTDNAGNDETVNSASVQIDKSAPSTTDNSSAAYVNKLYPATQGILLDCEDGSDSSGCNTTIYCVWEFPDQSTCTPSTIYYGEDVNVDVGCATGSCSKYIRYYSKDAVDNTESSTQESYKINTWNCGSVSGCTYLEGWVDCEGSSDLTNCGYIENSTIIDSDIDNSTILYSEIFDSDIIQSFIDPSVVNESYTFESNITNSTVVRCTVNYSEIDESYLIDCIIISSYIENSDIIRSNITESDIINSNVTDSFVNDSFILDSNINLSEILNSDIENSEIFDSLISDSEVNDSTVISSDVTEGSDIDNSNIENSDIVNSTIADSDVNDSSVIDSTVTEGSDIDNSNIENSLVENSTVADSDVNDSTVIDSTVTEGSDIDNSNIENSLIENSTVEDSDVNDSTVIDSTVTEGSDIDNSNIENSLVENSTVADSDVNDSSVIDSTVTEGSDIDNSNIENSFVENSTVADSDVNDSTVIDSTVTEGSDIDNSNIENSLIENSTVADSNVNDSTVIDSSVTEGSDIDNSNIENSLVENSTVTDSDVNDSTVIDSTVTEGSDIDNSNIENSLIENSTVVDSDVNDSTVIDSTVTEGSDIDNSNIENSLVENSTVADSDVNDSTVIDSTVTEGSDIDNSNIENSLVENSTVADSDVNDSTVIDSTITEGSDIDNSNIENSLVENSTVADSDVNDSTVIDSTVTEGSDIDGSNITGSDIVNSTVTDSDVNESTVIDSTVTEGSDIDNSNITGSDIVNSTVTDSDVNDSTVIDSTVTEGSDIDGSNITGSDIVNSTVTDSDVNESTVIDSTVTEGSDIDNSNITGSDIVNSTVTDSDVNESTVIDSTVTEGSDIDGSNITGSDIVNSTVTDSDVNESTVIDSTVTEGSDIDGSNITG
ncbi:NosD domain-containing protein, partial [Nanoarchaeota archaeon]